MFSELTGAELALLMSKLRSATERGAAQTQVYLGFLMIPEATATLAMVSEITDLRRDIIMYRLHSPAPWRAP